MTARLKRSSPIAGIAISIWPSRYPRAGIFGDFGAFGALPATFMGKCYRMALSLKTKHPAKSSARKLDARPIGHSELWRNGADCLHDSHRLLTINSVAVGLRSE